MDSMVVLISIPLVELFKSLRFISLKDSDPLPLLRLLMLPAFLLLIVCIFCESLEGDRAGVSAFNRVSLC